MSGKVIGTIIFAFIMFGVYGAIVWDLYKKKNVPLNSWKYTLYLGLVLFIIAFVGYVLDAFRFLG